MAAKRTIRYRGHTIRLWDKSYQIDNASVVFLGYEPDAHAVKKLIDELIASDPIYDVAPRSKAEPTYRNPTWRERLFRAIELRLGMGGDLHRQVFYAWRDYPDAMKLTIALFFALGSLFACVALIVGAWAIRG